MGELLGPSVINVEGMGALAGADWIHKLTLPWKDSATHFTDENGGGREEITYPRSQNPASAWGGGSWPRIVTGFLSVTQNIASYQDDGING